MDALRLVSCLLLTGCAGSYRPYHVINNTSHMLQVAQDGGQPVDLRPGEQLGLRPVLFRNTAVTVVGYDQGQPVGADSWTFVPAVTPEVWTVSRLIPVNAERP